MKNFLKNISFFLCGLIIIFILNFGINHLIINNLKVSTIPSEVLIIGDSHTQRAINPTLFNNAQNISQSAEPYVITYWKLKALISKISPDTVIIGFAPHNFSDFNDLKFSNKRWRNEMFERTYLIHNFKSLTKITIDYESYYTFLFKRLCLFPRFNHIQYLGGYNNSNKTNVTNVESTIQRHFYFNKKPANISEISISYLDSIISLCVSNNSVPILVNTPVHSTYKSKIPKNILEKFNIEKKKWKLRGVKVINNNSTEYPNNKFYNSDHLNILGSKKYTPTLIQLLREKD